MLERYVVVRHLGIYDCQLNSCDRLAGQATLGLVRPYVGWSVAGYILDDQTVVVGLLFRQQGLTDMLFRL